MRLLFGVLGAAVIGAWWFLRVYDGYERRGLDAGDARAAAVLAAGSGILAVYAVQIGDAVFFTVHAALASFSATEAVLLQRAAAEEV